MEPFHHSIRPYPQPVHRPAPTCVSSDRKNFLRDSETPLDSRLFSDPLIHNI
jgi:hypothetical protein